MRRRWIEKETDRLHWERYGDPGDGTHDTLIDCANDAIEAWHARHRIAEACRNANTNLFGDGPSDDWYQIADAVIAELGLHPDPLSHGNSMVRFQSKWLDRLTDDGDVNG